MLYWLKKKWVEGAEQVLMSICVPLILIFFSVATCLAFKWASPLCLLAGYALVVVTFLVMAFGGQYLIDRRRAREAKAREEMKEYGDSIQAVRDELGITDLLKKT